MESMLIYIQPTVYIIHTFQVVWHHPFEGLEDKGHYGDGTKRLLHLSILSFNLNRYKTFHLYLHGQEEGRGYPL